MVAQAQYTSWWPQTHWRSDDKRYINYLQESHGGEVKRLATDYRFSKVRLYFGGESYSSGVKSSLS
jgi:hypothetical protein